MVNSSRNTLSSPEPESRFYLLAISSAAFLVCLGATWLGGVITGVEATNGQIGTDLASVKTWVFGALLTIPMLILLILERKSQIMWLRELWESAADILEPIILRVTFCELVLISLLAGIGEELLFRGFLQNWMLHQSWLKEHQIAVALILPNVLFGVLHWISPGYAACTFCVGIYFSCLLNFVDSVNLTTLIIGHSLYDLIALTVLVREVRSRGSVGESHSVGNREVSG